MALKEVVVQVPSRQLCSRAPSSSPPLSSLQETGSFVVWLFRSFVSPALSLSPFLLLPVEGLLRILYFNLGRGKGARFAVTRRFPCTPRLVTVR